MKRMMIAVLLAVLIVSCGKREAVKNEPKERVEETESAEEPKADDIYLTTWSREKNPIEDVKTGENYSEELQKEFIKIFNSFDIEKGTEETTPGDYSNRIASDIGELSFNREDFEEEKLEVLRIEKNVPLIFTLKKGEPLREELENFTEKLDWEDEAPDTGRINQLYLDLTAKNPLEEPLDREFPDVLKTPAGDIRYDKDDLGGPTVAVRKVEEENGKELVSDFEFPQEDPWVKEFREILKTEETKE